MCVCNAIIIINMIYEYIPSVVYEFGEAWTNLSLIICIHNYYIKLYYIHIMLLGIQSITNISLLIITKSYFLLEMI